MYFPMEIKWRSNGDHIITVQIIIWYYHDTIMACINPKIKQTSLVYKTRPQRMFLSHLINNSFPLFYSVNAYNYQQ